LHGDTESKMDKEFLSQIDNIDELISSSLEKLPDETLICECFVVSSADIRAACQDIQRFDLKRVQDNFGLGHGCLNCLKQIDSWVNKIF
jgi:NAD(P)H-nitrite reductase large subunit